jgi:hypothetical protein
MDNLVLRELFRIAKKAIFKEKLQWKHLHIRYPHVFVFTNI